MESTLAFRRKKRKLLKTTGYHLPMMFKSSSEGPMSKKQTKRIDSAADIAITHLFSKQFEIAKDVHFKLPDAKYLFVQEPWNIEALQSLKKDLNETKSILNDYNLAEWSHHTRMRNKAGEVQWRLRKNVQPELLTQAWCKFYENACTFPLVPEKAISSGKLTSVHLCEAPGAFVTSLNHWLKLNASNIEWNWLATTLNPHYEGNSLSSMVNVDCFIIKTLKNWFFGADWTGNIMDLNNLDALVKKAGSDVMFVTADGSIDCLDTPAEQEEVVSQLHFCETVAALHLLQSGGSFLLKVFTIFEHQTIGLIYLLSCCFEKIVINKPATSKEGNSEVYVVCLGFAGFDYVAPYIDIFRKHYESSSGKAMFRRNDIPETFIQQIITCGEFFKSHQCEVILNNIRTFRSDNEDYYLDPIIKKIKPMVADRFMKNYNLRSLLSDELKIVGNIKIEQHGSAVDNFRMPHDSYNSRRKRENLEPKQRLLIMCKDLHFISEPDNEITFKFNGTLDNLEIATGKPYRNIESSKFCTPAVLKMFKVATNIMKESGSLEEIPSTEDVKDFIRINNEKNCDSTKVLNFGYNSPMDSHKLITEVYDALTNLDRNKNLIFVGYTLLSQLNVGLLYFLAHAFDSLDMRINNKMGCIITMRNNTGKEKISETFEKIYNASREAKTKGIAVLSVLPVSMLCDWTLYKDIININHTVIELCIRRIAENFKEQK